MAKLSDILFSYEVTITLFVNSILFLLLSIAFYNSLFILKKYKKESSSELQYSLEKKSYLVTTIIFVALIIKIFMLPYFTYTINELSNIIPGAMCGAGVISANSYGEPLIVLKVVIIILVLLWLTLNKEDLHSKDFKYFTQKIWFYLFIYLWISVEIVLEYLYFTNLTTLNPVFCCSTLYSSFYNTNTLPFNMTIKEVLIAFFVAYLSVIFMSYLKKKYFVVIFSFIYIYLSYFSIVYFFGTYVYQLPTHKCPYCLLQSEYYFIGYFIYSALIISVFYSIRALIFNFDKNIFQKVRIWHSLSLFFIILNFIIYLALNRTFL